MTEEVTEEIVSCASAPKMGFSTLRDLRDPENSREQSDQVRMECRAIN